MGSFSIRLDDDLLARFDKRREEEEPEQSREGLVRRLIERYVEGEPEDYYTIKAYSDDHLRYADIHYMDGYVRAHSIGFDGDDKLALALEHASELAERNEPGDKEAAINIFKSIFGERNVFVKKED